MSQENVELLHRAVDAFNGRDLDAYLALQDSDIDFTPYERAVEGLGPYRGHEGVRTWWENSFEAFPDLHADYDEMREVGDVTFARGRLHGQGATSGAPFERMIWIAVRWRYGKMVWWHAYENEAQALKAVGLEE